MGGVTLLQPALLRELSTNLGLISVLVLVVAMAQPYAQLYPRTQRFLVGAAFGLMAIVAMHAPMMLSPNVRVDGKSVMIVLAAAFLPLEAAVVALAITC